MASSLSLSPSAPLSISPSLICSVCTYRNPITAIRCEICESPFDSPHPSSSPVPCTTSDSLSSVSSFVASDRTRPSSSSSSHSVVDLYDGLDCPYCTFKNRKGVHNCEQCSGSLKKRKMKFEHNTPQHQDTPRESNQREGLNYDLLILISFSFSPFLLFLPITPALPFRETNRYSAIHYIWYHSLVKKAIRSRESDRDWSWWDTRD